MQVFRESVEALYDVLYENLRKQYMAVNDQDKENLLVKYKVILDLLLSADKQISDGFKNLLFARYKEYIYYMGHIPDFTYEDEFIMLEFERIIKRFYGEWFFQNHRLNKEHWVFADGSYDLFFTPDFIQSVYDT